MVQAPLDLELTLHLREEVELLKHVLEDDLEGNLHLRTLLDCLEDLTELA